MSKPIEDYDSDLTEEQKQILDDTPPSVVNHLLDYCRENGQMPRFNLKVSNKLTGLERFVEFNGVSAVNAMDYLRYLIRNGYKDIANAG